MHLYLNESINHEILERVSSGQTQKQSTLKLLYWYRVHMGAHCFHLALWIIINSPTNMSQI